MQDLIALVSNRPDFWLSLIVILAMLGMAVYFVRFVIRNVRNDTAHPAPPRERPRQDAH